MQKFPLFHQIFITSIVSPDMRYLKCLPCAIRIIQSAREIAAVFGISYLLREMSKTSWNEKISLYARFHARRKFTCQDSKKFWGTFKMSKISKGWFCFEPFKIKKLSCKKWCFWKSWSKLLAWTFWSATWAFPCRVHAAVGVLISDLEWSKRFHMQNYLLK